MQPESLSQQEVKQPESPLIQKTKTQPKRNLTAIVLMVFLVIICVAVTGLGFLAYNLNSELAATQQQLTSLQKEHAKLQSNYAKIKSDNEKLIADLSQSKADLEKINGDLTTAQINLGILQNQNKRLQGRIELASKKMEILYVFSNGRNTTDILTIDTLVKETNDKQLLAEWDSFVSSPSADSSVKFLFYLIGAIRDDLKVVNGELLGFSD